MDDYHISTHFQVSLKFLQQRRGIHLVRKESDGRSNRCSALALKWGQGAAAAHTLSCSRSLSLLFLVLPLLAMPSLLSLEQEERRNRSSLPRDYNKKLMEK